MLRDSPGTIIIPVGEQAGYSDFWICLRRMAVPSGTFVTSPKGSSVADNLNKAFRSVKGDWVQIWGNDHTFAPDLLSKLLDRLDEHPEIDIIVPLCAKRRPPYYPPFCVDWWKQDTGAMAEVPWGIVPSPEEKVFEVTQTGLAGGVLRRSVIDRMADPWFEWNTIFDTTRKPMVRTYLGEDYQFCREAAKLGIRIFIDLENSIGHIITPSVVPKWDGKKWVQNIVIGDVILTQVVQRTVPGEEIE